MIKTFIIIYGNDKKQFIKVVEAQTQSLAIRKLYKHYAPAGTGIIEVIDDNSEITAEQKPDGYLFTGTNLEQNDG